MAPRSSARAGLALREARRFDGSDNVLLRYAAVDPQIGSGAVLRGAVAGGVVLLAVGSLAWWLTRRRP